MSVVGYRKELAANYKTYVDLKNFTDGRVEKVDQYLISYLTERGDDDKANRAFSNRKERLYNINYCAPYLYIHLGHLSQEILVADNDSKKLKAVVEDVNQYGDPLKIAFQDYLWNYLQDGMVGILVDKESLPKDSSKEQTEYIRSYQEMFDATCIRNYSYYTSGKNKGKFKELYLTTGFYSETQGDKTVYKEKVLHFTLPEDGFYTWEKLISSEEYRPGDYAANQKLDFILDTSEAANKGDGAFDQIPFKIIGEGALESMIGEVMPLNKALMNKRSVRSNVLYNQGFQRSFVIGAKKEEIKQVGEFLVIPLANKDASVSTIPAGDVTGLTEEIVDLKNEIDRRGRLEFNQLSDDTRQVQNADSKALDKMGKKRIYSVIIDRFQAALTDLMRFHALFDEGANFDLTKITVKISKDFGLDDSTLELQLYQQAYFFCKDINADKAKKAIVKAVVSKLKFLPEKGKKEGEVLSDEETLKLILEDIDNAKPAEELEVPNLFGEDKNSGGDNTTVQ